MFTLPQLQRDNDASEQGGASETKKELVVATAAPRRELSKTKVPDSIVIGQDFTFEALKAGATTTLAAASVEKANGKQKISASVDAAGGAITWTINLSGAVSPADKTALSGNGQCVLVANFMNKKYEFSGCSATFSGDDKIVTVKCPKPPKKFTLDLRGTVKIGVDKTDASKPPAAVITVNFGNANDAGDWVFKVVPDSAGRDSYVKVKAMIDFVKGAAKSDTAMTGADLVPKTGATPPAVKDINGVAKEPDDLEVNIKGFEINASQGTFLLDLKSTPGTNMEVINGVTLSDIEFFVSYDIDNATRDRISKAK